MFKIRRLFLGKGKKKGKDYLWIKCPQVKERKGTYTCGQNVQMHISINPLFIRLSRIFFRFLPHNLPQFIRKKNRLGYYAAGQFI